MPKIEAKKTLGQNFLKDNQMAQLMVKSLDLNGTDTIVEIGGGTGALTRLVVEKCNDYKHFRVYEIDQDLKPGLEKILKSSTNPNTINELYFENFLDADLGLSVPYKILGSLPYYITSPIIHKILRQTHRPEICIFLVQKEVGEKLLSEVPNATYWSHTTLGYRVEKVAIVKAEMFNPVPKVDSMIVKFTRLPKAEEELMKIGFTKWEKFLHHVYKNPRKMINKVFDKEFLSTLGIDSNLRPQNLDIEQLMRIYKARNA